MGCWNGTCALSNLYIKDGEAVYVFVLGKLAGDAHGVLCDPLSKWEPIMLPIEATYDSHGAFENADGNLEYILEGLSKYKVVVGDIVSDDLKVDYESLTLSSKQQLLIEESNDGFRHYISFALIKKSVAESLFESLTLEDDYRRWQFSWKNIDNQIDGLIQDCLASHERVIAWNIGKCAIDFLTAQSPDFWGDEFSGISSAAKLLSLYWGDCRWGLVDNARNVVRNCVEGNYPLAHLILKDLLTASFICETMRITRKAWMPEGTVEASQSKETAGYIAMCKAIEKEIHKEVGNGT